MIYLKKLNDEVIIVNAEAILTVESTPDTHITLLNGEKLTVKESAQELVARVVEYKQLILKSPQIIASDVRDGQI